MKAIVFVGLLSVLLTGFSSQANEFQVETSQFEFTETVSRLKAQLKKMKLTLFAEVPHSENAKKIGGELRPTTLLIFGNPKIGSQLMAGNQQSGFSLPMKALVYQTQKGNVEVAYTNISSVMKIYELDNKKALKKKVTKALAKVVSSIKK